MRRRAKARGGTLAMRLLSCALSVVLVVGLMPGLAFAGEGSGGGASGAGVGLIAGELQAQEVAETDVYKIGDTGYATAKDAIEAAQNGDTIVLLKDTEDWLRVNGKTLTIDFNGHVLTTSPRYNALDVENGADVTLLDSQATAATGAVGGIVKPNNSGWWTNMYGVYFSKGGTVKILSGRYEFPGVDRADIWGQGTVTLGAEGADNALLLFGTAGDGKTLGTFGGSTFTVNSGTFRGGSGFGVDGSIVIKGGDFECSGAVITANNSASLKISGGTFKSTGGTPIVANGTADVEVSGGTFIAGGDAYCFSATAGTLMFLAGLYSNPPMDPGASATALYPTGKGPGFDDGWWRIGAYAPTVLEPENPVLYKEVAADAFAFKALPAATSWAVASGSLPSGLALDAATGEVSGTPTATGDFTFSVAATNATGTSAARECTWTVLEPVATVTAKELPGAAVNESYSQQLEATGYLEGLSFTLAEGSLPDGLTLSPEGLISGTPTTAGTYTFGIAAVNAKGTGPTVSFTCTVDPLRVVQNYTTKDKYSSLQAAIDAAGDGNRLSLLVDLDESVVVPEGKNVTIDLAAHKLSGAGGHTISNHGTIMVYSMTSGTGELACDIAGKAALYNAPGATATVRSGNSSRLVTVTAGANAAAAVINEGTMTLPPASNAQNKITVSSESSTAPLVVNGWTDPSAHSGDAMATMSILGGTFQGGSCNVAAEAFGTATISNGTFTSPASGGNILAHGGTANVSGGTFTAPGSNILLGDAADAAASPVSVKVTGGTFTAGENATPIDRAPGASADKLGELDFQAGGGTYNAYPIADVLEGVVKYLDGASPVQQDNGTWTIKAVAPTITSTETALAVRMGQAFETTFTATGSAPLAWSVAEGDLPAGLTLSADGVLSGTAEATGTSAVTLRVSNGVGSADLPITITSSGPKAAIGLATEHGSVDAVEVLDTAGNLLLDAGVAYDAETKAISITLPHSYAPDTTVIARFTLTQADGLPYLHGRPSSVGTTIEEGKLDWPVRAGTGAVTLGVMENDGTLNDSGQPYNHSVARLTITSTVENTLPSLAAGQASAELRDAFLEDSVRFDPAPLFTDADGDDLDYYVTIDGGTQRIWTATSSWRPTSTGIHTFVVTASDGFGVSDATCTIKFNVVRAEDYHDVTFVVGQKASVKFYECAGFNEDGTDKLGAQLKASQPYWSTQWHSDGINKISGRPQYGSQQLIAYTVRVPRDVDYISYRATWDDPAYINHKYFYGCSLYDDLGGMAVPMTNDTDEVHLGMQRIYVETQLDGKALTADQASVQVTYGDGKRATTGYGRIADNHHGYTGYELMYPCMMVATSTGFPYNEPDALGVATEKGYGFDFTYDVTAVPAEDIASRFLANTVHDVRTLENTTVNFGHENYIVVGLADLNDITLAESTVELYQNDYATTQLKMAEPYEGTFALAEGATLPAGLSLSADGLISGQLTADIGSYEVPVVLKAEGMERGVERTLTINVKEFFAYTGVKTEAKIYDDYDSDLWLNAQHVKLNVGDTFDLYPWREIFIGQDGGLISPPVISPVYDIEKIRGDSVDVPSQFDSYLIDSKGVIGSYPYRDEYQAIKVTAERTGTTILKLSYRSWENFNIQDYVSYQAGPLKDYAATPDNNIAYVVFTVGETGTATITSSIDNWRPYDAVYFTEADHADFDITASAQGAADFFVTCNGLKVEPKEAGGNVYTLPLENRANIVGLVATDAEGNTTSTYRIIDGRYMEIVVDNLTNPGKELQAGDAARFTYRGVVMPINRLMGYYNPQFAATGYNNLQSGITYENDVVGVTRAMRNQYSLEDAWTRTDIVFPEGGDYTFTGSGIEMGWWGQALGSELAGGTGVNFDGDAPSYGGMFSPGMMPSFTVHVVDPEAPKYETVDGTAYLSVSQDGAYVTSDGAQPGTVMARVPIDLAEVAKIDLDDYGFGDYKYDADRDGLYDVTLLQLYLYANQRFAASGAEGMTTNGEPQHLFLTSFFGMDQKLLYYVNGSFPVDLDLDPNGTQGATADRIVLADGDDVAVNHYSKSANGKPFHYFTDADGAITFALDAAVGKETPVALAVTREGHDDAGAITTSLVPEGAGYEVSFGTEYGKALGTAATGADGVATLVFPEKGEYLVWADGAASDDPENEGPVASGPAIAKVVVTDYNEAYAAAVEAADLAAEAAATDAELAAAAAQTADALAQAAAAQTDPVEKAQIAEAAAEAASNSQKLAEAAKKSADAALAAAQAVAAAARTDAEKAAAAERVSTAQSATQAAAGKLADAQACATEATSAASKAKQEAEAAGGSASTKPESAKTDIAKAKVAVAKATYTGKVLKPKVTVKLSGKTLKAGTDYKIVYVNNKKAGAGVAIAVGKGSYDGAAYKTFKIAKGKNAFKAKAKAAKKAIAVKAGKKVAAKKYVKIGKRTFGGKVTYKLAKAPAKVKKYLKVNAKTGKLAVGKKARKGTYTVKVKLTSKSTANYKAQSRIVKLKLRVR